MLPKNDYSGQVSQLEKICRENKGVPCFSEKLKTAGMFPLKATGVEIFQVNIGKMCNQTCKHCHVGAGPDRVELMSKSHMERCLGILKGSNIPTVDITGGAPEMHPRFRWFVKEVKKLEKHVMVRCNLTVVLHGDNLDLPAFYREHQVEVISSLPFYNPSRTDRQRGEGVFDKSLKVIKMLNQEGYGQEGSGLKLNLVYNPAGAFLPSGQSGLEKEFKKKLKEEHDVRFNNLLAINNMPIGRFLEFVQRSGNEIQYLEKLAEAFNPAAAMGVMCRNTISVGWDGFIYDCDFNQMLGLKIKNGQIMHLDNFNLDYLGQREIILSTHCYGCTAGGGSGCGGATA